MGFISIATAILSDVSYAAEMLFNKWFEECAAGAIYWQNAKKEPKD